MNSPKGIKRPLPENYNLEPVKLCKLAIKENIPPVTELYHGSTSNQNGFLSEKQFYEKATPKKCSQHEDPVTPNTNFKMLTSLAAELDYANCSTPRSRNSNQDSAISKQSCNNLEAVDYRPNRKEKSLAIICTRFLAMYPLYPFLDISIVVSLDEASVKLGIERRRLYDIVNVFESIDMLKKLAKNRYVWFGKNNLLSALHRIKAAAFKENVFEKLQYVLKFEENMPESRQSCILDEVRDFNKNFEIQKSSSLTPEILRNPSPLPELRKEKSLAIMSQKFLMLFLVSPTKVISLGVAAKVLNGFQNSEKGAQIKTQIRRLYDIANVLSSIGLIQKEVTIGQNGRKPAFKYIGPDLEDYTEISVKTVYKAVSNSKKHLPNLKPRSLVRHSSFQEICAVAEIERQKLYLDEMPNSAPPFEKNFQNINKITDQISFAHLKFNLDNGMKNTKSDSHLSDLKNLPIFLGNNPTISSNNNVKTQVPLKPVPLQKPSNFKVINLPKQLLTANGPYYILNPTTKEVLKSPTPLGTLLLLNPLSINKPSKVVPDKITENKVPASQTSESSAEQRDTILYSLNVALSAGQVTALQLEGSSKSTTLDKNPRCNLIKLIEKQEEPNSLESSKVTSLKQECSEIGPNELESNETSSNYSHDNNSPSESSTRFDSPISIPSGSSTPVSIALPDISYLSNRGTESNTKENENQSNSAKSCKFGSFAQSFQQEARSDLENSLQEFALQIPKGKDKIFLSYKQKLPLGEIQNLPLTNSCSSDSLNAEVSAIFKGEDLGANATKLKPFLIDEKTILSPIKKHEADMLTKPLTPSPFITPPYIVPDTIFVFNNLPLSCQSSGINTYSFPKCLQVSNSTNNKVTKIDFPAS